MLEKIEKVLDQYVRPELSKHYGDVKVVDFSDNILRIKLLGQCSNCPSAKFTVEDVIEKEVKAHVSNVDKVVLIEGVSDELIEFAKTLLNKRTGGRDEGRS